MARNIKKKIIVLILILILVNLAIIVMLFRSHSFVRFAIWNIIESDNNDDFYWEPKDAPEYFCFEENNNKLDVFRNEIIPRVLDIKTGQLNKVLLVAQYIRELGEDASTRDLFIWDSPEGMLRQIKEGKRGAHCLHYSIIFSTYLSSLGINSRLWALEGPDGPGGASHTVTEIYLDDDKKWILIDPFRGIYFTLRGKYLSVLALRERLLNNQTRDIEIDCIDDAAMNRNQIIINYTGFMHSIFLRTGNDFVNKYDSRLRYGPFAGFSGCLDKLPSDVRRGLDYLLGRKDYLIHYRDRFDGSLYLKIIIAKFCFYWPIITSVILSLLFIIFFAINLSRKATFHK